MEKQKQTTQYEPFEEKQKPTTPYEPFEKKPKPPCAICGKEFEKDLRCSQCNLVPYCSKECQTVDYPQHKRYCRPISFGVIPDKYSKLITHSTDEMEITMIALQDIGENTEVLADDPVFFVTSFDFTRLGPEEKKVLVGGTTSKFFWANDKMFEDCEDTSDKYITIGSEKALWIVLEQRLKLYWCGTELNPRMVHHKTFKNRQNVLEKICNRIKNIYPLDPYMISCLMAPSMTPVYSRGTMFEIGTGFFMNAWSLTMSCNPNCISFIGEGKLRIVSCREIKKGDAITIGFHPLILLNNLSQRTTHLKDIYGVKQCLCSRCLLESSDEYDSKNKKRDPSDMQDITEFMETIKKDLEEEAVDPRKVVKVFGKLLTHKKTICEDLLLYNSIDIVLGSYYMYFMLQIDDVTPEQGLGDENKQKIDAMNTLLIMTDTLLKDTKLKAQRDLKHEQTFRFTQYDADIHTFLYHVKMDFYPCMQKISSPDPKKPLDDPEDERHHQSNVQVIRGLWKKTVHFMPTSSLDLEVSMLNIIQKDWQKMRTYYELN